MCREGVNIFPDPCLTANVYCSGLLDDLLHRVIAPFWARLCDETVSQDSYLWVMRYAKRGEHLKIRLHGPEALAEPARERLERSVGNYLSSLEPIVDGAPRLSHEGVPAIDAEDDGPGDLPDRSLLWTSYRRSPVALAGRPFFFDDDYVSAFTCCLAVGCEMVLATLTPDAQGQYPHRPRQTTLLRALVSGLTSLGFPSNLMAAYLSYHRDWLLRYLLARSNDELKEAGDFSGVIGRFDRRLETMSSAVRSLSRILLARQAEFTSPESELEARWIEALIRLKERVVSFAHHPEYRLDPFALDPVFAPTFKVFHGFANQLGLNLPEEAFVHHFLLMAYGMND